MLSHLAHPERLMMFGLALCLISVASAAPTALAHSCTAEEGSSQQGSCETECTEDEDHHHRITHHHENAWETDVNHIHYECRTKKEEVREDPGCMIPRVLGICIIEKPGRLDPLGW